MHVNPPPATPRFPAGYVVVTSIVQMSPRSPAALKSTVLKNPLPSTRRLALKRGAGEDLARFAVIIGVRLQGPSRPQCNRADPERCAVGLLRSVILVLVGGLSGHSQREWCGCSWLGDGLALAEAEGEDERVVLALALALGDGDGEALFAVAPEW